MKKVREPIRIGWIWAVLVVIILLGVPWYLPVGSIYPIIAGFPYWAFISLVMSVALSAFLTYVVRNWWDMSELVEESKEGGSKQ